MKATAITLILSAGLLTACANPAYHEGDSASAAMRAAAAESTTVSGSIDGAWTALDQLLAAKEGDMRPTFDRFSGQVDALKSSIAALGSRTDKMSSAASTHLGRWERELKEVKSEDLRRKSLQRRAEVEERVRKVKELSGQTKQRADACVADLEDVRHVLGTDLTVGGVATVQDAAARARASSAALKDSAAKLTAELDALGKDIASPPTQPPPPKEKPAEAPAAKDKPAAEPSK